MYWKSKTLLVKPEVSYGTDPVPAAGANAILATNVSLQPMEGEDVDRNLETPYFGGSAKIPVGLYAVLSFDVELQGSGAAGTAPAWGPVLRACGVAETITPGTKVEYSPITDGQESVAIYLAIDTVRHVLLGSRGTVVKKLNAQGIPVMSFTLTGLFAVPTTQAKVVPTLTAFKAPLVATKANTPTFTIGGVAMILRSFEMNLGNQVEQRLLVGYEGIHITGREESLKAQVEAVALATYNPFTIAQNQTLQAIALTHGVAAGYKWTLDVASAQQHRLSGYANEQNIVEWPLDFTPLPTAGNDQWKLTFD